MGEAGLRQVAFGDPAAVVAFDQLGDAVQKLLALGGIQRAVAGVGQQEIAVGSLGVRFGPLVATEDSRLE